MKKIGLITWFTYHNYGTLLQCKAMLSIIEKLGYSVELINYKPRPNYKTIKYSLFRKGINYTKRKIVKKSTKSLFLEQKKMDEYIEKYPKTTEVNTEPQLNALNDEFDAFVCGSDQIWLPSAFDENYFLSFVQDNNKKISYAPSLGTTTISNKIIKNKMKMLISPFGFLSVREQQGAEVIKELTNREAKVVLDPTLLLDHADWQKEMVGINESNYIAAYFLGKNKEYIEICNKIAKRFNKKIVFIPNKPEDLLNPNAATNDIGPKEFLSIIDGADLILTDSYHGTIFSINFKKDFIAFKRFKDNNFSQNSRIINILTKLELMDHLYEDNIEIALKNSLNTDYSIVHDKLNLLKKDSIDFLSGALEKSTKYDVSHNKIHITNICTGCGVCAISCPKKCIDIKKNENGFYEYKINHKDCIQCGICKKVCAQRNELEDKKINTRSLYSGCSVDKSIMKKSASGGICVNIAKSYLESNIKVISCSYNYNKQQAEMIILDNIKDLELIQGSKYLQAFTVDAYKEIQNMDNGVIIGTPCQIASLDLYLKMKNKRNSFLLIDFICHGVPTDLLWKRYIQDFDTPNKISFRNKDKGWHSKVMKINTMNRNYIKSEKKDLFYHFFNVGNIYNKCCYECKYRKSSCADIRVGDYWGPKFKNNLDGMSMIIPFTELGERTITKLENEKIIDLNKEDVKDYFLYQQSENIRINLNYEQIIDDLKNSNISLSEIDKKYNKKILRKQLFWKFVDKIRRK